MLTLRGDGGWQIWAEGREFSLACNQVQLCTLKPTQVLRESEECRKSQAEFIEKEKPTQTKAEVLAQTTREGDRLCSVHTHPAWEAASGGSTGRGERPALRLLLELQIVFCGWPFSLSRNK